MRPTGGACGASAIRGQWPARTAEERHEDMLRNPSGALSRAVATLLLATLLPVSTTACFGSFRLTQKLHQFNREVSQDRWTRWFIFLLMAGFPVYAAGLVIDGLFGNAIEFWGGRNPFAMAPGTTEVLAGADGSLLHRLESGVPNDRFGRAHGCAVRGPTNTPRWRRPPPAGSRASARGGSCSAC